MNDIDEPAELPVDAYSATAPARVLEREFLNDNAEWVAARAKVVSCVTARAICWEDAIVFHTNNQTGRIT